MFSCYKCQRSFETERALKMHVGSHEKDGAEETKNADQLKEAKAAANQGIAPDFKGLKLALELGPGRCNICGQEAHEVGTLSPEEQTLFKCDRCFKSFSDSRALKQHQLLTCSSK